VNANLHFCAASIHAMGVGERLPCWAVQPARCAGWRSSRGSRPCWCSGRPPVAAVGAERHDRATLSSGWSSRVGMTSCYWVGLTSESGGTSSDEQGYGNTSIAWEAPHIRPTFHICSRRCVYHYQRDLVLDEKKQRGAPNAWLKRRDQSAELAQQTKKRLRSSAG